MGGTRCQRLVAASLAAAFARLRLRLRLWVRGQAAPQDTACSCASDGGRICCSVSNIRLHELKCSLTMLLPR